MSVGTLSAERRELDPLTGQDRRSHLVAHREGRAGHDLVFEARILGRAVTALCGHGLIPSRDARDYSTCERCFELFRESTGAEDGWRDA